MTSPDQTLNNINAYVGCTFEITLEAQTASTGYSWFLAHMPDSVNLIDMRHEATHSARCGSIEKQIFVFIAIKTDQACIAFNLSRPWAPLTAAANKSFTLTITAKASSLEQTLESTLGSASFAPQSAVATAPSEASVINHPEKCLLAYGTPDGIAGTPAECALKYGFPLYMQNGSDACNVKYGIPLEAVSLSSNCNVKYGIPATELNNCNIKYGFPVAVQEDADNCVIKYGIPAGIAATPDACILKYGVPVTVREDTDKCLLKYGAPPVQTK